MHVVKYPFMPQEKELQHACKKTAYMQKFRKKIQEDRKIAVKSPFEKIQEPQASRNRRYVSARRSNSSSRLSGTRKPP